MRRGRNRELGDGFVRAGIRLVIKDMDGAVAGLQEVDMPGDMTRLWPASGFAGGAVPSDDCDAVFFFERGDSFSQSQIGTSTATVTLSLASMKRCSLEWRSWLEPTPGMIKRRRIGGRVVFFHHDEPIKGQEIVREFRGARAVVAPEEIVGTGPGQHQKKIGELWQISYRPCGGHRACRRAGRRNFYEDEVLPIRTMPQFIRVLGKRS